MKMMVAWAWKVSNYQWKGSTPIRRRCVELLLIFTIAMSLLFVSKFFVPLLVNQLKQLHCCCSILYGIMRIFLQCKIPLRFGNFWSQSWWHHHQEYLCVWMILGEKCDSWTLEISQNWSKVNPSTWYLIQAVSLHMNTCMKIISWTYKVGWFAHPKTSKKNDFQTWMALGFRKDKLGARSKIWTQAR